MVGVRHRDGRWGIATLAMAAALAASGCGSLVSGLVAVPDAPTNSERIGPALPVGSGLENGGWRAWAYRTRDGMTCLEVDGTHGGGSSCAPGVDGLAGPGMSADDQGTYVSGGTRKRTAAEVVVHLADGSASRAPVVEATGIASGVRVYVVPLPPGSRPLAVDVTDAEGNVLETTNLGG